MQPPRGRTSTPAAAPASLSPAPPNPLILPYTLAHTLLATFHLLLSTSASDAYGISRSVLQLASSLSLFPSAAATTGRAPTLAALAAFLALLVDAALRFLAATHQVLHGFGVLRSSRRDTAVSLLQSALCFSAAALVAPRAWPYLHATAVPSGGADTAGVAGAGVAGTGVAGAAAAAAAAAATPRRRSRRRRGAREATDKTDLGLLLILMHAGSCLAARAADVAAALVGEEGGAMPAVVDALAAVACIGALRAPVRMLGRVLLQATPVRLAPVLRARLERVGEVEGVVSVARANFWEETPGVCVGAISVVVLYGVENGEVVRSVAALFENVVDQLFVEVEEEHASAPGGAQYSQAATGGGDGKGGGHYRLLADAVTDSLS